MSHLTQLRKAGAGLCRAAQHERLSRTCLRALKRSPRSVLLQLNPGRARTNARVNGWAGTRRASGAVPSPRRSGATRRRGPRPDPGIRRTTSSPEHCRPGRGKHEHHDRARSGGGGQRAIWSAVDVGNASPRGRAIRTGPATRSEYLGGTQCTQAASGPGICSAMRGQRRKTSTTVRVIIVAPPANGRPTATFTADVDQARIGRRPRRHRNPAVTSTTGSVSDRLRVSRAMLVSAFQCWASPSPASPASRPPDVRGEAGSAARRIPGWFMVTHRPRTRALIDTAVGSAGGRGTRVLATGQRIGSANTRPLSTTLASSSTALHQRPHQWQSR